MLVPLPGASLQCIIKVLRTARPGEGNLSEQQKGRDLRVMPLPFADWFERIAVQRSPAQPSPAGLYRISTVQHCTVALLQYH